MTAKAAKAPTKKTKTAKPKAKVAATTKPSVAQKETGSPKNNLRAWNLRLGLLLVVMAVAVVVAGNSETVPVTTQYLAKDTLASEAAGHDVLATATRHLADVRLSWIVAKFLLIFAVFYLLYATLLRKHYETWLDGGVNKLRWVSLGAGTGLMAVAVAMLSGISDLGYLVLIFSSLLILGSLSTVVELIGPGRKLRKYVIITALCTAALPVIVIGRTAAGVPLYDGSLPTYMYYLYGSMFLVAGAVAAACIFRLRKRGKWADTYYTERMFMGLGFAAATILALQIFAGALQS